MGKRAAVYNRISRDRTGLRAGVDRQDHDCRELVERRGWELVEVLTDNDVSAYSGKPRPGYERLVGLVRAGAVDVVVAWHPDRLTRSPRELEDFIDTLEAADCTVETVMAGRWDLSTRSGRMVARVVGATARDESEAKSERLRAMHEHKARRGEYRGSTRHYGYRPNGRGGMDVVSEEAAVIREAARRILAGESMHAVCADLNRRGVVTVRGNLWRPQTMRRMLTSWTVCGRREHRGEDVGPAQWEPILSRPERDRLARVINDPERSRVSPARVSLLAGVVRCAHCGMKLITGRRQTGRRVYTCRATTLGGCARVQINADDVDEFVTRAVIAVLDTPRLAEAVDEARHGRAKDPAVELEEIEADLEALAADHGARRISRREWLAAREPLEAARDELRARQAAAARTAVLAPYTGRPGALADAWGSLTLDQRRAIVTAVVDRVLVRRATRRGPGVDLSRIEIPDDAWLV